MLKPIGAPWNTGISVTEANSTAESPAISNYQDSLEQASPVAEMNSFFAAQEPDIVVTDGTGDTQASKTQQSSPQHDLLANAGMSNVSDPPTEKEFREYYSQYAPVNELIVEGLYADAAKEYRKLASSATDAAETARLNTTAEQLEVLQKMKNAGVKNLEFPPTEKNFKEYFRSFRGKDVSEIDSAYEQYCDAFFIHSEEPNVSRGDVKYDPESNTIGKTKWTTHSPEDWKDVTDSREIFFNGRRIIDCEGYAYLGKLALESAGFTHAEFTTASRIDDPATTQDESLSAHIMFSAQRKIHGKKEYVAISNAKMFHDEVAAKASKGEREITHGNLLVKAYRKTFGHPGGIMMHDRRAWRAIVDLDQELKRRRAQAAD